jgi:hypothetical protein
MKSAILSVLFLSLFLIADAFSQSLPEPRQSPVGLTRMLIDDCYVKVIYGRPSVREREIFGSLVPYGEVWRTGANEATEITTTGDITFGDNLLPAGTYSLFTIPEEDTWTIILNEQLGQWGSYTYNHDRDVFRIQAESERMNEKTEMFTILLESDNDKKGRMTFEWEHTRVVIPIELQ